MEREPEVAKNYASALLAAVKKHGTSLDDAQREAAELRELVIGRPRFKVFLEGPQFNMEEKEGVIKHAFEGNASELMYRFLLLLLKRGRLDHLIDILEEFHNLIEQEKGFTEGKVITAVELSDEEKDQLRGRLHDYCGCKFELTYAVDPAILGGVRVQFKDTLIDDTIQTRLTQLRRRLTHARLAS